MLVSNPAGPDKNAYYNEFFLRGKLFLSQRIQRIMVKGNGPRRPGSPESEPNFYGMPFLPSTSAPTVNDRRGVTEEQQYAVTELVTKRQSLGPSGELWFRNANSMSFLAPNSVAAESLPVNMNPTHFSFDSRAAHHQQIPVPCTLSHGGLSSSGLARALILQSIAADRRRVAAAFTAVDPTMVLVQRYLQRQAQHGGGFDPLVLAAILQD
jgi:hypothetical protein